MTPIKRTEYETHCSGVATMPDGTNLYTLERPNLDNKPFISCIPYGVYVNERDHSGKHQYYKVLDVENRSFIEHHPCTYVSELEGCLGWSMSPTDSGRTNHSKQACDELLKWFGDSSWVMEII